MAAVVIVSPLTDPQHLEHRDQNVMRLGSRIFPQVRQLPRALVDVSDYFAQSRGLVIRADDRDSGILNGFDRDAVGVRRVGV